MEKKKEEESEKKLYMTSENGDSSSFPIVSGADQLHRLSRTGALPQGEETIEVVLKLPALRLSSLLSAMELEENTKISIPAPFSNLPSILSGRSLVPLPPTIEEQQQQYNSPSSERTTTSGPSSSSSSSHLPHPISNAASALFLRIGSWQAVPKNEGDLVLKFDYRTKKMAWEIVMEGPSKHKIEIDWSNIIGIEAAIEDHRQGILQLELQKPPRFYKEIESKLLKHSKWVDEADFTEGKASLNRRHFSVFSPGVLGAHYKRLIKNKHLLEKQRFCRRIHDMSREILPCCSQSQALAEVCTDVGRSGLLSMHSHFHRDAPSDPNDSTLTLLRQDDWVSLDFC